MEEKRLKQQSDLQSFLLMLLKEHMDRWCESVLYEFSLIHIVLWQCGFIFVTGVFENFDHAIEYC